MRDILKVVLFVAVLAATWIADSTVAQAERGPLLGSRRGPWIRYRYPLFGASNRPQHVRNEAGAAYRRESYWQLYPKYIGGFHAREWQAIGRPPGESGFRGTAW